jgi:predicted nucleotidyltransferase
LTPPDSVRLRELLARLIEADVRFVLVGGLAVNAWGYLRATRDVDFVPDPNPENLTRLNSLLRDLGGKVEVDGKLLDGSAIFTFLRTGDRALVATELGPVDVLQGLPQVPPFAALDEKAKDVDLDGFVVRVCSLEHLIQMKRSSERPRDREDLAALEVVQKEDQERK